RQTEGPARAGPHCRTPATEAVRAAHPSGQPRRLRASSAASSAVRRASSAVSRALPLSCSARPSCCFRSSPVASPAFSLAVQAASGSPHSAVSTIPTWPSGGQLRSVGCPQGRPARGPRQTGRGLPESQNAADPGSARMAVMAYDTSGLPDVSGLKVGILGGTGDQGRGLAYRLARAGHPVLVGSRNAVRGEAVATDLSTMPGVAAPVTGGENRWAAEGADLVIVAVPWDGHAAT